MSQALLQIPCQAPRAPWVGENRGGRRRPCTVAAQSSRRDALRRCVVAEPGAPAACCIIPAMRANTQLFEQLSQTINRMLPRELTDEVRENVKGGIAGVLDRFDLVTREELEIQEAVLRRTREKLETLEAQVAELEQLLADRPRQD